MSVRSSSAGGPAPPGRDPTDEARRRLERLPADRLAEVAARFARRAAEDGLYVLRAGGEPAEGAASTPTRPARVPIPPLLTPVLPDGEAPGAARDLLEAVLLVARAILSGRHAEPAAMLAGFTPLERDCIRDGWRDAERVASARVDFLREAGGALAALELNTTIPAMQGYSDIVSRAFVTEVAPALGSPPAAVREALDRLPSNVDELRRSLLAHAAETGSGRPGRVALLARRYDAQTGELTWIAARFRDAGLDPVIVSPDDFFEKGPYDLVYRHLFARRVEAGHPIEAVFRAPRRFGMWNPVNGHLEVKGMLALVSTAAADPSAAAALGLPDDLLARLRGVVPWSRILRAGSTTGPDGEAIPDLVAWSAANAGALVLKRSWEYGGRGVFLAEDFRERAIAERLSALVGRPIEDWGSLVRFAAADTTDCWIVQRRIRPARRRHLRAAASGPVWEELITDVSAFAGHGASFAPTGQTARASASPVVNIVSGGGMAPIVPRGILERLLA